MPLDLPPALRGTLSLLKTWSFWGCFLVLVMLGIALQRVGPNPHALVCTGYHTYFEADVGKAIDETLPASERAPQAHSQQATSTSSTAPAADEQNGSLRDKLKGAIRDYFCSMASKDPRQQTWDAPTPGEFKIVLPGAFVLALITVSLLPFPAKREDIANRMADARALAQAAPAIIGLTPAQSTVIARKYTELALIARQFRIAIIYAMLSGLATLLLQPTFARHGAGGSMRSNVWHICGLVAAAAGAALYGTFGFSKTEVPKLRLALRLGFGAIFLGSLIGACISIPYQVLRPPELAPMTAANVLVLIVIRFVLLPSIACILVWATLPLMKQFST